jgi:hypothetical protein
VENADPARSHSRRTYRTKVREAKQKRYGRDDFTGLAVQD